MPTALILPLAIAALTCAPIKAPDVEPGVYRSETGWITVTEGDSTALYCRFLKVAKTK